MNLEKKTFICKSVSRKLPPRKIAPRSGSGFGLELALELGLGAIFLGAIFLEPKFMHIMFNVEIVSL